MYNRYLHICTELLVRWARGHKYGMAMVWRVLGDLLSVYRWGWYEVGTNDIFWQNIWLQILLLTNIILVVKGDGAVCYRLGVSLHVLLWALAKFQVLPSHKEVAHRTLFGKVGRFGWRTGMPFFGLSSRLFGPLGGSFPWDSPSRASANQELGRQSCILLFVGKHGISASPAGVRLPL